MKTLRQLILILSLVLIGVSGYSQGVTPVEVLRVANATTTFDVNIAVGKQIYDIGTDKLYVCKTASVSTLTLTTGTANFTLIGGSGTDSVYDSLAVHLDTLESHNTRINSLGDGTVESVGFGDGTGFTINGSPITTSGSFEFALDFSEFTDITESTGIKFVVTDPVEKEIDIRDVDLSDFNNDLGLVNLYDTTVALNAIQVAALGTYKELIAAPGAGKYLRILNCDCKIVKVNTRLDVGAQTLFLIYSRKAGAYFYLFDNTSVEVDTTTRFKPSGVSAATGAREIPENTGFGAILSTSTNPASGDGTMSFNLTYEILDY